MSDPIGVRRKTVAKMYTTTFDGDRELLSPAIKPISKPGNGNIPG
jgi:hypothetical protein